MSIDSTWLRCPNCSRPLTELDGRVLGCETGHRFDISKHGIVTLLPPGAPRTVGDTREMLDARAELLGSGVYEPIATAIGEACASAAHAGSGPLRIVDLGCGTGYYSAHLAAAFPGTAFLVADRSPIAVRMASRAVPHATGVVLDLWRPLPIRDASADVAINVFAPRNPDEFARITRSGGSLVVVVPTDRHLGELRAHGGMLDIPSGKADQVFDRFARAGFDLDEQRRVEYVVSLDEAQTRSLMGMGPSAHHVAEDAGDVAVSPTARPESAPASDATTEVTVSVDVLHFRRT